MVNTILYFRLAPLLLMLPLVVNAVDHGALHDEQLLEEAEFIEQLMSEQADALLEETLLEETEPTEQLMSEQEVNALVEDTPLEEAEFIEQQVSEQADVLVEETPLVSPAEDNAANTGVIDRHPISPSTAQSDKVTRSAFTLAVVDREPVDEVSVVSADSVYYFTELSGLEGAMVRHRWVYQGEVMADVEFQVGGPRWRVWSKKSLLPRWPGQWNVSVVNEDGVVMQSETVEYRP